MGRSEKNTSISSSWNSLNHAVDYLSRMIEEMGGMWCIGALPVGVTAGGSVQGQRLVRFASFNTEIEGGCKKKKPNETKNPTKQEIN